MADPIDPAELLEAAELLHRSSSGEAGQPNAMHRRAVSTAYYAVFHSLTEVVATTVFPEADESFRQRIRRWIGHSDVKTVAQWVSQIEGAGLGRPPPHIAALLTPTGASILDATTGSIAKGFVDLNEARDQADYDHSAVFTHASVVGLIARAREVVDLIEGATGPGAEAFFGLIAMQARVQSR